jgi:hypothetical protein
MKKNLLAISILKDEATTFSRNVRDQTPKDVPAYIRNELNSTQLRWISMSSIVDFMFIIPCIVNQFQKKSNKMALLYSILLIPVSRSTCFG